MSRQHILSAVYTALTVIGAYGAVIGIFHAAFALGLYAGAPA